MKLPKAGQIIYCKSCDEPILKYIVDIQQGDSFLHPTQFEPIGKQIIGLSGTRANCSYCGSQIDPRNFR